MRQTNTRQRTSLDCAWPVHVQDGLALRGWRDSGSCFELRASSTLAPDGLVCLYEAEVLLLAPGAWAQHCLDLFGLTVDELQVRLVDIPACNVTMRCGAVNRSCSVALDELGSLVKVLSAAVLSWPKADHVYGRNQLSDVRSLS